MRTVDNSQVHNDLWVQDATEIGCLCTRSEAGIIQRPAALRGLRAKHDKKNIDCEPLDNAVAAFLEESGIAVICAAEPREDTRWIDWFGNLEVSPPVHDQAGREYPFGRVLTGIQHGLTIHPDIIKFLDRQGVQTPVVTVDTSWLLIGHVDEVVSFVPAPDRQGFRVLLPSTRLAESILRDALEGGHAALPVFVSRRQEMTVASLLERISTSAENAVIQTKIDCTREFLCIELGLSHEDFVEMPALFEDGIALIPNAVNSLICNGHIIVPRPFGPVVNGDDVFEAAIRSTLEPLNNTVWFVDDWDSLHERAGEIHCGTNAVRRLSLD